MGNARLCFLRKTPANFQGRMKCKRAFEMFDLLILDRAVCYASGVLDIHLYDYLIVLVYSGRNKKT